MGICYDETKIAGAGASTPVHTWDGTKLYLTHYANLLYLGFIAKSTKNGSERRQAEAEIVIAERKMAFWAKHPRYEHDKALRGISDLKKQWSSK